MDLTKISAGPNPPKEIHAIIENSLGTTAVEYQIDKDSGVLYVDRFLNTAVANPGNYGFVPHTLLPVGEPCKVLLIAPAPLLFGAVVRCRPVGLLSLESQADEHNIILSVPSEDISSFYGDIRSYEQLPAILRDQIAHFFSIYQDPGRKGATKIRGWLAPEESEKFIMDAIERARRTG